MSAALAILALLCGFVHAPFLHLHTDGIESDEGAFHLHAQTNGIGGQPERAVYLDWSAAQVVPYTAVVDSGNPEPIPVVAPRRPHGIEVRPAPDHSPPRGRPESPRPPPVR
jgi:hypothetical protein